MLRRRFARTYGGNLSDDQGRRGTGQCSDAARSGSGPVASKPRQISIRTVPRAETVKAGAVGFLTKEKAPQQLIAAIRRAAQGDVLLTPDQLARIRAWEEGVGARWERLTKREREILGLMAEGKTTAHIAAALVVTENTVRTHVGNLLGKLRLASREAAIAWAWKHGFIEDETDAEGA
jgi:DNA-binding CsgD family transcriptional regulator